MPRDFCTRVTRKIRRAGHPEKLARRYARFFCVSLISVCACPIGPIRGTDGREKKSSDFFELSGSAPGLEGRGAIGDEIRRIFQRVLTLLSAVFYPDAGAGIPWREFSSPIEDQVHHAFVL